MKTNESENITKIEKVNIARIALEKNMGYETLYYSDYLHGREHLTDEIWEYVTEAKDNGLNWFYEHYKEELK